MKENQLSPRQRIAAPIPSPKPRPMKGLPMQDRVAQRRALLLVAALEAFGTRGFHAVTVREICAGAGLTERYFSESFKSLEALFSALYLQLNGQLKQATLAALIAAHTSSSASDSSGRIDVLAGAALRVLLEFIRDDPRRARVMLIDAISISHDVQQISGQITREYMELTRRFIDQLFPDAASRGVDLDLIASGLAIYQALGAYWPKLAASTMPDKPTPAA